MEQQIFLIYAYRHTKHHKRVSSKENVNMTTMLMSYCPLFPLTILWVFPRHPSPLPLCIFHSYRRFPSYIHLLMNHYKGQRICWLRRKKRDREVMTCIYVYWDWYIFFFFGWLLRLPLEYLYMADFPWPSASFGMARHGKEKRYFHKVIFVDKGWLSLKHIHIHLREEHEDCASEGILTFFVWFALFPFFSIYLIREFLQSFLELSQKGATKYLIALFFASVFFFSFTVYFFMMFEFFFM